MVNLLIRESRPESTAEDLGDHRHRDKNRFPSLDGH